MRFNVKEAHWLGERIKERILQAVKETLFNYCFLTFVYTMLQVFFNLGSIKILLILFYNHLVLYVFLLIPFIYLFLIM
jgi:hypothetical protein